MPVCPEPVLSEPAAIDNGPDQRHDQQGAGMSVGSVYLTRLDLKDAVIALLASPAERQEMAIEPTVTAELGGKPVKATLERVHRYVDEQLADARTWGVHEQSVRDELVQLLAANPGADDESPLLEEADPEADRDVAHQIIAALARRYPLSLEQRATLPVTE
ncbi:hypothetical protein AB0G73_32055 [Streptomyces sp. NPDC020719]|uniref:hypothetical protein n=1 Tax=Streptomyces sp. NPDC020719 TaxID=3154896 RepID=UPI0033F4054E